MRTPIITIGSILLSAPALAQQRGLQELLQNAGRVDCSFSAIATADWPADGPGITIDESDFSAAFTNINVESGTADAEGRFGASYIIVRYAEGYLHFMQTLTAGPIYLTTILAQPTTEGRLKAVHTRHEYTAVSLPNFTSRPEMYVGDCSVEPKDAEDDGWNFDE